MSSFFLDRCWRFIFSLSRQYFTAISCHLRYFLINFVSFLFVVSLLLVKLVLLLPLMSGCVALLCLRHIPQHKKNRRERKCSVGSFELWVYAKNYQQHSGMWRNEVNKFFFLSRSWPYQRAQWYQKVQNLNLNFKAKFTTAEYSSRKFADSQ